MELKVISLLNQMGGFSDSCFSLMLASVEYNYNQAVRIAERGWSVDVKNLVLVFVLGSELMDVVVIVWMYIQFGMVQ